MINTFKWPEMQYATLRWSGQWTNIDLKYSSFVHFNLLQRARQIWDLARKRIQLMEIRLV